MRNLLFLIGLIFLPISIAKGQSEYLNFIENEFFFDPDNLTDEWILDDLIDPELMQKSYPVTERFHIRGIVSSNYKTGTPELKNRLRVSARNRKLKMSFLAQKEHLTAGVELDPIPRRVKILFGDFGFDFGLGLLFSSKNRFNSWLQDPHQQLHRAGGFRVNSSSDTSRFLRGAGIHYRYKRLNLQAFFSDRAEGAFIHHKTDRIHAGFGVSKFTYRSLEYLRCGPHIKYLAGGGILFGELAVQNNGGEAFEIGYSYFGNERHGFIIRYSYYSKGYTPGFSLLGFTKVSVSDQRRIMLNYKWEWRSNWFLHADIQSVTGLLLPVKAVSPEDDWSFKVGVIRRLNDSNQFLARLTASGEGVKTMARWRIGLGEKGSYTQFESGWSEKSERNQDHPQNFYFAVDIRRKSSQEKWTANAGLCLHQSSDKALLLYRYEPDLFYSMSLPVLSGSGIRGYIKIKYEVNEDFKIEFKYNREVSFDQTSESVSNQIKLQIIYSPQVDFGDFQ